MAKTLGFIGLGVMGLPMSRNLSGKYPGLLVYDVDKERSRSLPEGQAQAVGDIPGIASRADIVFLSLPSSAVVREVVLGGDGLTSHMKKGSVVVDTSTTEVTVVKEMAAELEKRGVGFIDAPVSGGEMAAIGGTLSFMIGAKKDAFEETKEYFHAMGASVVHMGDICTGQIAKAVNQMIVGSTFAVIAESFALGAKSGLDPKTLYNAIKGGWAGSKVLDVAANDMLSREFKPGGTVDIHWKDLGYALSLSKDNDVPVPVTAIVHEIFKAAKAKGHGKESQPAVVRLWESLLGIEIK
ncbi:MAG: NAD(P)-binding domain-containing protein [Treponema sp.]|nr:NAD(P)-binding domain-containing protein [Treponema sp.]